MAVCTEKILQFFAAVATELVVLAHFPVAARAVAVLDVFLRLVDEGGADDTRGDGDNRVAQQHDERREEAAEEGDGRDVAVAHGGHRDHRPVERRAQVGEGGIGLSALNDVHHGAHTCNQNQHKEEIDGNLVEALAQRPQQQLPLVDEGEQAEDAEDADEADATQDDHVAGVGDEDAEVGWQDGQQVDDAEEA